MATYNVCSLALVAGLALTLPALAQPVLTIEDGSYIQIGQLDAFQLPRTRIPLDVGSKKVDGSAPFSVSPEHMQPLVARALAASRRVEVELVGPMLGTLKPTSSGIHIGSSAPLRVTLVERFSASSSLLDFSLTTETAATENSDLSGVPADAVTGSAVLIGVSRTDASAHISPNTEVLVSLNVKLLGWTP